MYVRMRFPRSKHKIGERALYEEKRRRKDSVKKLFHIILRPALHLFTLSVNLIFIALLLLSGLASEISPETFILPSLLSLGFLFFVILNILYVIYWIVRFKIHFVYSLSVLILLSTNIQNYFTIHIFSNKAVTETNIDKITVLSYNVKLFNFYEKDKNGHNAIIDYILKRDADIVCLQEFGFYQDKSFLSYKEIAEKFAQKYPYSHLLYQINPNGRSSYGIALYSKHPIIRRAKVNYQSLYNLTSVTDILLPNEVVRVYNCHLESNRLTSHDKQKMMEVVGNGKKEDIGITTGLLSRKIGEASKLRAMQAEAIRRSIKRSNLQVILCGDMNDTPASYTYKHTRGDLDDAFTKTSVGLGYTYNEFPLFFRIDYILHSKSITPEDFLIDKTDLSDHYPISCTLNIKRIY